MFFIFFMFFYLFNDLFIVNIIFCFYDEFHNLFCCEYIDEF
jgi:hypothetical protein